jgi:tetratricopeptide (TPR) repeat protein
MSILDGMPRSAEEVNTAVEMAVKMTDRYLGSMELTSQSQEVVELLKQGLSLADIYAISKEERDALLQRGYQYIRAGQLDKARAWLLGLYQLETLDPRVIYALGATLQLQGDVASAAKLYVCSIALDAENPEGYLRLGECLLSAREYRSAFECFQLAKKLCDAGQGNAKAAAHAGKMLTHATEHLASS